MQDLDGGLGVRAVGLEVGVVLHALVRFCRPFWYRGKVHVGVIARPVMFGLLLTGALLVEEFQQLVGELLDLRGVLAAAALYDPLW